MAVSGDMGMPGRENGKPGHGAPPGHAGPASPALWFAEHGAGEPLVLLHGGLTDARFFSGNVPALADRFHVYTPDARGTGTPLTCPGRSPPNCSWRTRWPS